jgi:hypothetical protein
VNTIPFRERKHKNMKQKLEILLPVWRERGNLLSLFQVLALLLVARAISCAPQPDIPDYSDELSLISKCLGSTMVVKLSNESPSGISTPLNVDCYTVVTGAPGSSSEPVHIDGPSTRFP